MTEKLSKRNWFLITLFCFMGGIAWNTENMYFNTFLYNSVYGDASQAAMAGAMQGAWELSAKRKTSPCAMHSPSGAW